MSSTMPLLRSNPICGALADSIRYWVLILSTICLTLIISNSLALNFTIICMKRPAIVDLKTEINEGVYNETEHIPLFTPTERNALFLATAIGSLIGNLPIVFLASVFQLRKLFTLYGLISATATLLSPWAASAGFLYLFVVRVCQGMGVAIAFLCLDSISASWFSLAAAGAFLNIMSCYLQFGVVVTMPIAGALCESRFGWPALYYLQGTVTLISFLVFYTTFRDSPQMHKSVSQKELKIIEEGKKAMESDLKPKKIPYWAMLTDPMVWACLAAYAADEIGFQLFLQYGPLYLNQALGINVKGTGISAALPSALSMMMKFATGVMFDRFTCFSEKTKVNLFTSIALVGMAACFFSMAFLPSTNLPWWFIQASFTVSTVFSGFNFLGVFRCSQLISGPYSKVIMFWYVTISSLFVLLLPVLVNVLVSKGTIQQWGRLFIGIGIFEIVTIVFYNVAITDTNPRAWTKQSVASCASM